MYHLALRLTENSLRSCRVLGKKLSRGHFHLLLGLLIFGFAPVLFAQSGRRNDDSQTWDSIDQLPNDRAQSAVGIRARKFKSFQLNHGRLRQIIAGAPNEKSQTTRGSAAVVTLPMPDGTFARFRFVEAPVMAPELAAKFPEIMTFRGEGIDDPEASVRFDLTPAGLHAQILSPKGSVYIDPAFRGENGFHTSYYKRDYVRSEDFRCWVAEDAATAGRGSTGQGGGVMESFDAARSGGNLRTYRLAVAATGEYTAFHGGTLSAGMAAIVTAVNRVTGVYETELAIRLVLVANNDLLVFTNANSDPYSNGTPSSLLTQNQSTVDTIIGSGNYDIGHVFSTAGGGLAGLGVVCVAGQKARGETGTSSPIADAFYIDYVAHEMGHQFGGNHTFNSTTSNCGMGNRNSSTAYEQGSGSTIMAYAGICGSDDLQPHSDPYFHSASFDEILSYITLGSGNSCAVLSATGNNVPAVNAGTNYTIPQNTPFTLTATGSDPDGDPLTYCWEERDLGAATTVGAIDNGGSPLFRSFNPTASPARTFPRLSDLLNNTLTLGEVMPTTTRTMNFRVTARDNRAGGGGVNTSDMQVNVVTASGPFVVTSHNSGGIFSGIQTVTWNVAGTANAPVNAANVNIVLSTDGGFTYPYTLASSTPNDGSQSIVLPNITNNTARLKVEAAGNIFFDVCNTNFSIVPGIPLPLVSLESDALVMEGCPSTNSAIDPGEAVTLNFALKNSGTGNTTNLVVTLLLTNGVVSASAPQSYGVVVAGGASVTRAFSLVATGMCGGTFTAALQLQDGASNLGTILRTFNLGSMYATTVQRTNSTAITLPGSINNTKGPGGPFPSTISVSGVTGTVSKVKVMLDSFGHSWPADIDVLLVGPSGQTLLLMSDCGGGESNSVSGITLTFDDDAAGLLSDTAVLTNGTFKPSNYGTGDTFSSPAPAGTYGTTLSVFNGLNPNGIWSLYTQDDSSQDTGAIAQGWRLSITTSNSTCCSAPIALANLAVAQSVSAPNVNVGSNATYTIAVTNLGPETANSVIVTDAIPAGLTFVSAIATQGTCTNNSGVVTCNLGPMTNGAMASVSIQVVASSPGSKTNIANAVSSTLDPDVTNNTAVVILAVNALPFLSDIAGVVTNEDGVIGPISFNIGDLESPASNLVVSVASSNTNLFPLAGLILGGAGSNRSLTLTPALNQSGSATITVTVSDGMGAVADSFLVTVNPVNDVPILAAITNFTLVEGETLTFTNAANDVETPQGLLVFSLLNSPVNAGVDATNGVFTWVTTEADGPSTNHLSVVVTDDGIPSLSATQSFTIVILETNAAPVLTPITNHTLVEGESLVFTNIASDVDLPANVLAFTLANAPGAATMDATNGVFTWHTGEADGPSTNQISVIVHDNGTPSLSATQTFTVIVLETNSPPLLAAITNYTVVEGQTLTFTNVATDADLPVNGLTFALEGAPTNAVLNPTNGVFTWTPDEAQGPSSNHLTIIVSDDGTPSLSSTQTFAVIVLETNEAPVLAFISDKVIYEGTTLIVTNVATDLDLPPNDLVFGLLSAPTNAVINSTNGILSWTPTETQGPSSNYFTVVVSDNGNLTLSATQSFSVFVLETNSAPILIPIADQKIHAGGTLIVTNRAFDFDRPTNVLTFSLDPGAPATATIDPTTGLFSWSPTDDDADEVHSITVRVTDDGVPPRSDTRTFLVTVVGRPFITNMEIAGDVATVTWTALMGQTYRLQYVTNLNGTNWIDVLPTVTSGGSTASQVDAFDPSYQRLYRVILVP